MLYKCSMSLLYRISERRSAAPTLLAGTLAVLAILASPGQGRAGALSKPWPPGLKSRTKLVSAGAPRHGVYQAGFDIELAPGVLTYWRTPGDAGIPPVFSFAGSKNVAHVSVSYPAPSRLKEAGVVSWGYTTQVLYPLRVRVKRPDEPAVLRVDLHYATCDTLCVPARAQSAIRLAPNDPPGPDAAWIARWAARVPKPLPIAQAPRLRALNGGPHASWSVTFPDLSAGRADLFAEGPKDWYFDTNSTGPGRFRIVLAGRPAGQGFPVSPVTLTLVQGKRAYETPVSLDEAPAQR